MLKASPNLYQRRKHTQKSVKKITNTGDESWRDPGITMAAERESSLDSAALFKYR